MTTIDHLRAEIARAVAILAHHPSGALIAQTAAQCDQLAGLVSNHDPPHQWVELGMGYVYCRLCGIQQPSGGNTMSTEFNASIHYGINQDEIAVNGGVATDATSVSDAYITAHVPASADTDKASVEVSAACKVKCEIIADQPDGVVSVVVLVTAGASADNVAVGIHVGGVSQNLTGNSGTPITATF